MASFGPSAARTSHLFLRRLAAPLAAALLGLALLLGVGAPSASAATATPSGLKVVSASSVSLDLDWGSVKGAPRYRVQYATKSSMSGAKYKRFTHSTGEITGLKPGTKYYVKVRVIDDDGGNLSSYSKAVSATTKKAYSAPSGLTVTARGASTLGLTWGSRGAGVGYRVEYSTSSSMSKAKSVRSTPTSLTLQQLKPSTTYYVRVRVVTTGGDSLSPYSAPVKTSTTATTASGAAGPLRVASFNVKCANCFAGAPDEGTWYERRDAVVATIKAQAPDVIGVQEASQGWLKDSLGKPVNLSQFEDLRNRLGGAWTLSSTKRNNCVKDTTPSGCEPEDQGASQGTKILFDADRVEMLDSGSQLLSSLDTTSNPRYVAWAELRQRSSGKKFFFADAHLDHGEDHAEIRRQQAQQIAATIKENAGGLPVVVVGDWNSSRFADLGNAPYDTLVAAGYSDPLGGAYRTTKTAPGATVEHRINTWLNSYNDFVRQAKGNRTWVNGSYIDYMLMSPSIKVSEWETVANLDANGQLVGVIPSDHNMLRATVTLP